MNKLLHNIFGARALPENQGWTVKKYGNSTSYVSNGILTVETNNASLTYYAPLDWKNTVNNTKGWIIEFRMKIDPITYNSYTPAKAELHIDIHNGGDWAIYFFKDRMILDAPRFEYLMNTTDTFHVYRIIVQENSAR